MALFDLFRPGRLHIAWTYTTAGVIWRTHPVPGGKIIGEERDLEKKQVRFFCVNQKRGSVLWDKRGYDEGWWIGIAGTNSSTLFLQGYTTPDLPEHKSIIAVDLQSGRQLWADQEMHFVAAGDAAIVAYRGSIQGRNHFTLDCRSGKVLKDLGPEDFDAELREIDIAVLYPTPLEDNNDIRKYCDLRTIEGPVSATRHGQLLIFNYHARSAAGEEAHRVLNNTLTIADRKRGRILFSDILMNNAPAIVPESFFVHSDTLFYVRERNILTAIHLGPPAAEPPIKDPDSVPS